MINYELVENSSLLPLPKGSCLFFCDGNTQIAEMLSDSGRRVRKIPVSEKIIAHYEDLDEYEKLASDYDIILAYGFGGTLVAKALSNRLKETAYVLYGDNGNTEAFSPYSLFLKGDEMVESIAFNLKIYVDRVMVERESIDSTRIGLGSLLCVGAVLFDNLFVSLTDGDVQSSEKLSALLKEWKSIIDFAPQLELSRLSVYIVEKLVYFAEKNIFASKSSPILLSFLISLYKNTNRAYNNYIFQAGALIILLYVCYLKRELSNGLYVLDRYELLESLASKCGLNLGALLRNSTKRQVEYSRETLIIKEYKQEFISVLEQNEKLYSLYRKLRAASNAFWQEKISSYELILLAVLSDELRTDNSLLRHIIASGAISNVLINTKEKG